MVARLRSLANYYAQPELLVPPIEILPRLAWAGRSTLLAAPEKAGKSTLMRSAVAALTHGSEFLGGHTQQGRVIWLALDEPVGDLVRGLYQLDVPGDAVLIAETRPDSNELREAIGDYRPGLAVVDCLSNFASDIVTDPRQPHEWERLLQPLNDILREFDTAGVILHHTVRSAPRYADSRQIGASVDVILEMAQSPDDPTVRKIKSLGRPGGQDEYKVRFIHGRYELEGAEVSLEMRTYRAIAANPGISTTKLRTAVGGKARSVDETMRQLAAKHVIHDVGTNEGHAWEIVGQGGQQPPCLGQGQRQGTAEVPKSRGTAEDSDGTEPGTALPLSHPIAGGGQGVLGVNGTDPLAAGFARGDAWEAA